MSDTPEPLVDHNLVIEYLLNQIRLLSLQVAIADAKADTLKQAFDRNVTPVQPTTE